MKRHDLMDEVKADLDLVYDEVKQAELKSGESTFNAEVDSSFSHLENLRQVQNIAIEKLSLLSACYEYVMNIYQTEDAAIQIRDHLFRQQDIEEQGEHITNLCREFATSLHNFSYHDHSDTADHLVRKCWSNIIDQLRVLGRQV